MSQKLRKDPHSTEWRARSDQWSLRTQRSMVFNELGRVFVTKGAESEDLQFLLGAICDCASDVARGSAETWSSIPMGRWSSRLLSCFYASGRAAPMTNQILIGTYHDDRQIFFLAGTWNSTILPSLSSWTSPRPKGGGLLVLARPSDH